MKKILLIIIMLFLSITGVSAVDNKLYISSSDNKLYYDSKLFNTNKFMNYLDMIPGDTFNDELVIENHTKYNFKLYLKIKNRNNIDLMDYLTMKLYLDNQLMYDGDVIGTNLNNQDDVYYIGTFTPGQISKLDAYVNFSIDYSNMDNKDTLIVDWLFFAETYDNMEDDVIVEILPAPETGLTIDKNIIGYIVFGLCLVIALVIVIIFGKNKGDSDEK